MSENATKTREKELKMPKIRHRVAFAKVVKGMPIAKAMKEVGYSKTTIRNTEKLTATQGWKYLVEKHLSDKKLSKLHDKFLKKRESFVVSDGAQRGSHIEQTEQPHTDALKALEMSYRLKGKFPRDEDGGNKTLVVVVAGQSADRYKVVATESKELPQ